MAYHTMDSRTDLVGHFERMILFLDETFRVNQNTGRPLGALCGVAVPESSLVGFLEGVYQVRRPYHDNVLKAEDELKGKFLLNRPVLNAMEKTRYSAKWSLCEDLLHFSRRSSVRVFGIVSFDPALSSFVCDDETKLDSSFRRLFTRVDRYMKTEHPGRYVKLVFDSRQNKQNEKNARAITNFFTRSTLGSSFDSIVRVPFFGVSQAHNYGLQMADLVTTVVGLKFAGEIRVDPLWGIVKQMLYRMSLGERRISSLVVLKNEGLNE